MISTRFLASSAIALAIVLGSVVPTGAATIIFADSFDRDDSRNIDASLGGITDNTGSLLTADGVYTHGFVDPNNDDPTNGDPDNVAGNGGGAQISGNQLELADAQGTSNAFINHNFTNAQLLADGGFTVSVDVSGTNQSSSGQGGGFAIGMTAAAAADTGDAFTGTSSTSGLDKMTDAFTGSGNTDVSVAVSDFWAVLRGDGTLIWGGVGNSVTGAANDGPAYFGESNVGAKEGTISANFRLASFAAGENVDFQLFYNGVPQGSGSFAWDDGDANYIGLDARDNQGVYFDNLTIQTIPEPTSLALVGLLIGSGASVAAMRRRLG